MFHKLNKVNVMVTHTTLVYESVSSEVKYSYFNSLPANCQAHVHEACTRSDVPTCFHVTSQHSIESAYESWLKAKDYSLNWCGLQKVSFLGYYPLALYRLRWIRLLKIFICVEESHVQLGQYESKR